MDRHELLTRFRGLLEGRVDRLKEQGRRPDEFLAALTPIAERHGVLERLQATRGWLYCREGSWHTTNVAAAVLLGVTILEIEAVYRLTYGGKS